MCPTVVALRCIMNSSSAFGMVSPVCCTQAGHASILFQFSLPRKVLFFPDLCGVLDAGQSPLWEGAKNLDTHLPFLGWCIMKSVSDWTEACSSRLMGREGTISAYTHRERIQKTVFRTTFEKRWRFVPLNYSASVTLINFKCTISYSKTYRTYGLLPPS